MRIEVDLPPNVTKTLRDVERTYGLARADAVALLIVAGEAELTPGYVERLMETARRGR